MRLDRTARALFLWEFATGFVLAKLVDWRGHAHPRV